MTYYAYLSRNGNIIVDKYKGEIYRQSISRMIKREIGVYDSVDLIAARRTALELTNKTYA